jgi:tetratricopeptide (TPR) repeat protein/class 3 adenylate cyclase
VTRPIGARAIEPEFWQRIQDVFAAAIECERGDRARVLEDRCAANAALRREVEALLAAHDAPGSLDGLAEAIASATSWARAQALGWEGSRVGQYVVRSLLGAGGMGLVYRARDERLGRDVALKFLPPHLSTEPAAKQRFLVEARAAAALDHPNVCTIHEIGETGDGQLFIAMPLYDGETLQSRLNRGRLAFDEAVPIALQVARGLARAHARGIVHRDVKPSNVMRLADGTVKILDFGIAKFEDLALTGSGAHFGTVAYMSPEHVRGGTIDQRADIWALGILLHEMLTGARPFNGNDRQEVTNAILTSEPRLVTTSHPDVPAGIDAILRRALAKLPEHRYPSMSPFAADLAALASGREDHPGRRQSGDDEAVTFAADPEAPPHASERRRAAVLVTEVSDYATLVEQLAPAEAHRIVARIRDLAVDVVRRHGGLVNQAIGEEIVSLFGVPSAHEDDELRAVRAALELHARVRATAAAEWSAAVTIQSGLHAGPVVAERLTDGPRRYAIVGAPAQVASRLARLAGPDGVVVSPESHRIVAPFVHSTPCSSIVLEPELKPVSPFRVTGETGLETRLEVSERSGLTPYVGRQSELSMLTAHVDRARDGEGRVITVVGEAGAGKSRLLHELREQVAGDRGVRLLHGRCRAYGNATPYFPFVEVLRDAFELRTADSGDAHEIVARIRSLDASLDPFLPLYLHLLSLPSESFPLPRHLQGEQLQAALLDALAAAIVVLARNTTVLVLLEDWHWADAASEAALARMIEIVAAHRLLFIVTTRPGQGGTDDWRAQGTRIQLEPLDFASSTAIMRAVLGVERLSDDLARRVYERTGGNPFFLEQLCCVLLEQRGVETRDGEASVEGGAGTLSLPDTVQAVIRSRVDNLEPRAQEVLRVAAVTGRDFEHALLAAVLGPDVDLAPAIARLKASGLIQQTSVFPEVGYRFKHALTQEVGYDSLLGHHRKSLHGDVGRAIEARYADRLEEKSALLAHHFSRAEAWREAVRYGMQAADRASALSQFADALALLDQVLEWLARLPNDEGRRDRRADVLLHQERECETLGLRRRQQEIIDTLIQELAPRGPSMRLAQTYLREADLLTLLKRFSEADRGLSTALRLSHEHGDTALERNALRSLGLLRWHEGRHADALAITESALAFDRECHDESGVAGDLINLSNVLKSMGEHARARAAVEEALAMPALAGDPKKLLYALHSLANVHRCLGDADAALACLRRADDIARTHLLPIQRSFHLTAIAHIDLQQGRVEEAIRTYEEAVALSRRARHAEGLVHSLRTLGEVLFELGRHEEAVPRLREAARLFAQLEDVESEAAMWSRVAEALESAAPDDAAEAWRTVRQLRKRLGDPRGELIALEGIARAVRHTSSAESIPAFEAALRLAATLGESRREAALRNTLGILEWARGGYAQALRHYEAALVLVREHGGRAHEGLILNSIGVTLMRLNRSEEARTVLEESATLNHETGQRLLEAHALGALGQVFLADDRADRAIPYFEQALALRQALDDGAGEAHLNLQLVEAHAAAARAANAQRHQE